MRKAEPALFGGCQLRENRGGNVSGGWWDIVEAILEALLDEAQSVGGDSLWNAVVLGLRHARPLRIRARYASSRRQTRLGSLLTGKFSVRKERIFTACVRSPADCNAPR